MGGHIIEGRGLTQETSCLGEDNVDASSLSRLHQLLKELPHFAHKASEVIPPVQLIQVAT